MKLFFAYVACLAVITSVPAVEAQKPVSTKGHISADKNLSPEKTIANHIIERIKRNSPNNSKDPLLLDAKKLAEPKGLQTIHEFLVRDENLGGGTEEERSERLRKLVSNLDSELKPEKQEEIRAAIISGKPSTQSCPYIGCSLHLCHC